MACCRTDGPLILDSCYVTHKYGTSRCLQPWTFPGATTKDRPGPSVVFGYGRRRVLRNTLSQVTVGTLGASKVCPGFFSRGTVSICVATALVWAFEVECVDGLATPGDVERVDLAKW